MRQPLAGIAVVVQSDTCIKAAGWAGVLSLLYTSKKPVTVVQGGGRIVWSETPFWKEKFCPSHGDDGTERCSGCTRLQPRGAPAVSAQQALALPMHARVCLACPAHAPIMNSSYALLL